MAEKALTLRDLLLGILARVDVDPLSGCWNWTRAMSQSGARGCFYPACWLLGRTVRVNRLVLVLKTAPAEFPREAGETCWVWLTRVLLAYPRLDAAHTCDNAKCVNPLHLQWEPHRMNVQNQARRKREAA